ncbi:MAG: CBS domain-containing protein [Planctomycetes bacterium]|nr:CBS domain-containing protein [Planctomycetota bacterium]
MYKVKDVMRSNLITVSETTEILDVITILAENKITGVPVVDEKSNLLGLVTEKDILSIAYRIITDAPGALSSHENAGDIMTKDVVSFRPDDNLADVFQCFIDNSFRRIMVTENGKLVGLVSRKEIISYSFIKMSIGKTRA